MKLVDVFGRSSLILDLQATEKDGAIREMLALLVEAGKLDDDGAAKATEGILKRESEGSTGIGKGLAIPHAKNCEFLETGVLGVFGRSTTGVPFDAVDGEPVKVLFVVISAPESADDHLRVMRKVAMLHRDEKTLRFLATTASPDSIIDIFEEIDDGSP